MWLIVLIFVLASLIQLLYWLLVFRRAWSSITTPILPAKTPAVSIIVCAHNEAENLREHLPFLLKQSVFSHSRRPELDGTPETVASGAEAVGTARRVGKSRDQKGDPGESTNNHCELIIVDDGSTDETAGVVRNFQTNTPFLRLVQPKQPSRPGKKDALTAGIAAAQHEFLLLTDADCRPASDEWAALMTAPLARGAEVVLGYSPYFNTGSLLNRWQQFETHYTALQYLGFAQSGFPYMGVGRNLAYRKAFFQRAGGMTAHAHLPGGDDDLLLSQHARGKSTEVQLQNNAWTWSKPALSWKEYWQRKRRHLSVGSHYPSRMKWLLGGLALSHGLHYSLGLILLINGQWPLALGIYLLRMLVVALVSGKKHNLFTFLLFDAGLCGYYLFNIWATLLAPTSQKWENR